MALIGEICDKFPGQGHRGVTLELGHRGYLVNHKRIARVMRERHLAVRHKRRFVRTTDRHHGNLVFPNLYRNRITANPDEVWVADYRISGWHLDLRISPQLSTTCSRRIVGYAVSRYIDTELALAAFEAAVESRRPEPGLSSIIVTQVAQYASATYPEALVRYGLIGAMSVTGNPYDNAQAESFMRTLKVEENYLAGYETFADVASRLPLFLEDVYNARRMHSSLGYLSPKQFKDRLAQQVA